MRKEYLWLFFLFLFSCNKDDELEQARDILQLQSVKVGTITLEESQQVENAPVDKSLFLAFNLRIDRATVPDNIALKIESGEEVSVGFAYLDDDHTVSVVPEEPLLNNSLYTIEVGKVRAISGEEFPGASFTFRTEKGSFSLSSVSVNGINLNSSARISNIESDVLIEANFSHPLSASTSFEEYFQLAGKSGNVPLEFQLSEDQQVLSIASGDKLDDLAKYNFSISSGLTSEDGLSFNGFSKAFYTAVDSSYKFPEISEEALLTLIQEQTFKYYWDFGHPVSGMARERNTSGDLVTTGGSGFGLMAIITGIERGFISRQEGIDRINTIVNFLAEADRFHGAWPHWMDGRTGKVIAFSQKDNGGDLVETAFMIQGLLTVKQYLNNANPEEAAIISQIDQLWREVEWDWYTKVGENVLYWHWSPNYGWEMNHPIRGWDEALIVYVLAVSSPTHPVSTDVYHEGWARNGGMANGQNFYNINLPLGADYGGPLFFSHYSFLGLDPRNLKDQYADYWEQNVNHSLINQQHAIHNPHNFVGYGEASWGFTASDNHEGYSAHSPTNDKGVITPTAAVSSLPYTPEQSLEAIQHFYYILGDRLWGDYGFYDAFNPTEEWVADSYLAIDQGPIVIMIENYRTALLWNLFMENQEIIGGLETLGFTSW